MMRLALALGGNVLRAPGGPLAGQPLPLSQLRGLPTASLASVLTEGSRRRGFALRFDKLDAYLF